MKTKSLIVVSAFMMSAAVPVFAQTYQEEIICRMSADNCLHRDKIQDEVKMVASTSTESTETLEQKQADIRNRLHGSAYVKTEVKSGESCSPVNAETLEQMQEDFKDRLQGHAPKSRF